MTDSRLDIKNLCVDYPGSRVVNNVSFTLGNERLALVGESGSGKSDRPSPDGADSQTRQGNRRHT